ncbi:BatA domain-containing protein [Planctobacterium marinum]|uniref:BatA domain-containing protein n=1 Tax=Planctobacterium marinum TaxID=1631968 RepID=UPI001E464D3D|nr:BatA domain-containing protein [Planctobacterium marinum]MCC2605668.1 BatA domain-containing protein [Planctobacterium marinum]
MSFLLPLGLLFALAIVVPVIIHLLDPDKGKHIYLGSLQFLLKAKQTQQPNYRIQQWWLLLLRCLMIVLMALLLAQWLLPAVKSSQSYVLVPGDWPQHFSTQQQNQYTELLSEGATLIRKDVSGAELMATLAQLPAASSQHVFVRNSAAMVPEFRVAGRDNIFWHIAEQYRGPADAANWLILASGTTQSLANLMAQKLQTLPKLQVDVQLYSTTRSETHNYDMLINLSGQPLQESHFSLLNASAQIFSHAEQPQVHSLVAGFNDDGLPITLRQFFSGQIHHLFHPELLTKLDSWPEQPWFAASLLALYHNAGREGAIAANQVSEQLQRSQSGHPVKQPWQELLLLALLLVWLGERLLSFKLNKQRLAE